MVGSKAIVSLGVSFLLVAIVIPLGMTQLVAANTTGWDAAVTTVFTVLLPVLVIIGVALKYIPRGK